VPAAQPVLIAAAVQAHEVVSQQTPGHAVAQVPPQVNTFGKTHAAGATTVHAAFTTLQHLPVQGLGAQVLAGPW
jgi:hypothetical protein